MPEVSGNVLHWVVIGFGGVSAVTVIALVAYWLILELLRGPTVPGVGAPGDTPSNTARDRDGQLE